MRSSGHTIFQRFLVCHDYKKGLDVCYPAWNLCVIRAIWYGHWAAIAPLWQIPALSYASTDVANTLVDARRIYDHACKDDEKCTVLERYIKSLVLCWPLKSYGAIFVTIALLQLLNDKNDTINFNSWERNGIIVYITLIIWQLPKHLDVFRKWKYYGVFMMN